MAWTAITGGYELPAGETLGIEDLPVTQRVTGTVGSTNSITEIEVTNNALSISGELTWDIEKYFTNPEGELFLQVNSGGEATIGALVSAEGYDTYESKIATPIRNVVDILALSSGIVPFWPHTDKGIFVVKPGGTLRLLGLSVIGSNTLQQETPGSGDPNSFVEIKNCHFRSPDYSAVSGVTRGFFYSFASKVQIDTALFIRVEIQILNYDSSISFLRNITTLYAPIGFFIDSDCELLNPQSYGSIGPDLSISTNWTPDLSVFSNVVIRNSVLGAAMQAYGGNVLNRYRNRGYMRWIQDIEVITISQVDATALENINSYIIDINNGQRKNLNSEDDTAGKLYEFVSNSSGKSTQEITTCIVNVTAAGGDSISTIGSDNTGPYIKDIRTTYSVDLKDLSLTVRMRSYSHYLKSQVIAVTSPGGGAATTVTVVLLPDTTLTLSAAAAAALTALQTDADFNDYLKYIKTASVDAMLFTTVETDTFFKVNDQGEGVVLSGWSVRLKKGTNVVPGTATKSTKSLEVYVGSAGVFSVENWSKLHFNNLIIDEDVILNGFAAWTDAATSVGMDNYKLELTETANLVTEGLPWNFIIYGSGSGFTNEIIYESDGQVGSLITYYPVRRGRYTSVSVRVFGASVHEQTILYAGLPTTIALTIESEGDYLSHTAWLVEFSSGVRAAVIVDSSGVLTDKISLTSTNSGGSWGPAKMAQRIFATRKAIAVYNDTHSVHISEDDYVTTVGTKASILKPLTDRSTFGTVSDSYYDLLEVTETDKDLITAGIGITVQTTTLKGATCNGVAVGDVIYTLETTIASTSGTPTAKTLAAADIDADGAYIFVYNRTGPTGNVIRVRVMRRAHDSAMVTLTDASSVFAITQIAIQGVTVGTNVQQSPIPFSATGNLIKISANIYVINNTAPVSQQYFLDQFTTWLLTAPALFGIACKYPIIKVEFGYLDMDLNYNLTSSSTAVWRIGIHIQLANGHDTQGFLANTITVHPQKTVYVDGQFSAADAARTERIENQVTFLQQQAPRIYRMRNRDNDTALSVIAVSDSTIDGQAHIGLHIDGQHRPRGTGRKLSGFTTGATGVPIYAIDRIVSSVEAYSADVVLESTLLGTYFVYTLENNTTGIVQTGTLSEIEIKILNIVYDIISITYKEDLVTNNCEFVIKVAQLEVDNNDFHIGFIDIVFSGSASFMSGRYELELHYFHLFSNSYIFHYFFTSTVVNLPDEEITSTITVKSGDIIYLPVAQGEIGTIGTSTIAVGAEVWVQAVLGFGETDRIVLNNLPTVNDIVDAVWNEQSNGHTLAGSTGEGITNSENLLITLKKYHDNMTRFFAADGITGTNQETAYSIVVYDDDNITPIKTIKFYNASDEEVIITQAVYYKIS